MSLAMAIGTYIERSWEFFSFRQALSMTGYVLSSEAFWTAIGAIGTIITLYFIYTQVATAREVAAYEFLRKEDDRFRSDEMARHRSDLARTLLSMPRNYKEINEYADYVLDYFEDLGLLVKRRVAPPYVVWTTSCYYVLRYWELLKDYVAWVRREKQDPTYHDAFEHLYKEMVKLEKKNTKKSKIELSRSELREFLEEELYLEIRASRPEDLDRIVVIERLAFEVDAYEKADFEQLLREHPEGFFVAEMLGHVVGYVVGYVENGVGEVDSLAVDRRFRRLGVGRRLCRTLLDRFIASGVETCSLEVRVTNGGAHVKRCGNGSGGDPPWFRR